MACALRVRHTKLSCAAQLGLAILRRSSAACTWRIKLACALFASAMDRSGRVHPASCEHVS